VGADELIPLVEDDGEWDDRHYPSRSHQDGTIGSTEDSASDAQSSAGSISTAPTEYSVDPQAARKGMGGHVPKANVGTLLAGTPGLSVETLDPCRSMVDSN
jgi:hypothetical protein